MSSRQTPPRRNDADITLLFFRSFVKGKKSVAYYLLLFSSVDSSLAVQVPCSQTFRRHANSVNGYYGAGSTCST